MPRTADRGGARTRERVADAARGLFIERGFDAVTVAEVARAAGVSSVTVFNHFATKEDLFLDRSVDATDLLKSAVRDRAPQADVLNGLREASFHLFETRHPLSGVHERSTPFYETVAGSPALLARAREIASSLQETLTEELCRDPGFDGDGALLAALFISGYSCVMVETARRRIAGEAIEPVTDDHRARLERLFQALRHGVPSRAAATDRPQR